MCVFSIYTDPTPGPSSSVSSPKRKRKSNLQVQSTLEDFRPLAPNKINKITSALTYFIATEMMPYSIVEKPGFKFFVNSLQPQYQLPSRKHISTVKIPKLYTATREVLKEKLTDAHYYNITTDCWTSVNMDPYISLTIHFINKEWELKSMTLACEKLSTSHTGENLKKYIACSLRMWELKESNIIAATTDCGANILSAINLLTCKHVSCFGHVLNTGVSNALKRDEFVEILQKCKQLQSIVAHSYKLTQKLKDIQERFNKPHKKIPSSSPTRWWSTLHMLEVINDNYLPLTTLFSEDEKYKKKDITLSISENATLEVIIKSLKKYELISNHMCGESYVTASSIPPIVNTLQEQVILLDENEDPIKYIIDKTIFKYISQRYCDNISTKNCLAIAAYLDPRFKKTYSDQEEITFLHKKILEEGEEYANLSSESVQDTPETSGLAFILGLKSTQPKEKKSAKEVIQDEVIKYEQYSNVNINEDPLKWWKYNQNMFPTLSHLAKKYLSIQGSSVASERVFSCGGNVVSDIRSSLTSEHAEQLIFLAMNKEYVPKIL